MKHFLLGVLYVILLSASCNAQSKEAIPFVPDRPGFATPPDVVSFRKVQLENGFQYTNFFEGDVHIENFLFTSLLVRYGLAKFAELRIQSDFAYNIVKDSTAPTTVYGFNPVTIGTKIKLLSQQKVIPNISLLFNLTLPFIGQQEFLPKTFTPALYMLMSNDLTESLNICYNYGLTWFGGSEALLHFYTVCIDVHLHPKWDVFIEGYGYAALHAYPSYNMDTGAAFLINNHLQVDFSASGSITSIRDFYLLNMGIAWKIPGKDKTR
ncbi:MAG: transporter [Bacteroidetes bacterium]|nr:transporter [Bacteroidota bacterium]